MYNFWRFSIQTKSIIFLTGRNQLSFSATIPLVQTIFTNIIFDSQIIFICTQIFFFAMVNWKRSFPFFFFNPLPSFCWSHYVWLIRCVVDRFASRAPSIFMLFSWCSIDIPRTCGYNGEENGENWSLRLQ